MVCPWAAAFLLVLLVAPRVFRAPEGPAAREIATREPAARSGRSRSPPVPSGPSGALHTCGAWSLCVPVGGDPPVSRPRRELRSARRLVVRPGPAAHRHRGRPRRRPRAPRPALACRIAEPTLNFARNSLAALSNHELRSLELQRFQTLLRLHPIELRAIFVGGAAVTDECCGQVLGLPTDRYRGLVPPL